MTGFFDAYAAIGIDKPHAFQGTAWELITAGKNVLVSAGTGSGKTEAAFLPALETGHRVIALYPTKALLQDQLPRVEQLASRSRVAVDTGDEDDRTFYRADVVLTSLDKFLYRLFGYGKRRWSYLYPYRIAFDDTRGTTLILDEAHAYDEVAFSHFWFLLKKLTYERNVQTVLLSATLPPGLIDALQDADRRHFPRGTDEGRFFEEVTDDASRSGSLLYAGDVPAASVVEKAIDAFEQGKRVVVVLDAVVPPRDAERMNGRTLHEVWRQLVRDVEARAAGRTPHAVAAQTDGAGGLKGNLLTYHGHQMPGYRTQVLQRLKELDEDWKRSADDSRRQSEPFILVTTSAMEIGVDISSDVMITDLCDWDSFVQRIGRCARRPGESGEVYLIADDGGRRRRGRSLWEAFKDWRAGSPIDAGAKQSLNAQNSIPDLSRIHIRLEYLQDQSLYRYVYDFVQENRELWEKGVVITREWEPSIALVRSERRDGKDYIGGIPSRDFWRAKEIKEKMLLPVSAAADIAPLCTWVFDGYDEASQYAQRVPVGGSKMRSLLEAMRLAGLRPQLQKKDQDNKVRAVYGLDLPLVLMLPSISEIAQGIFPSDAVGVAYRKRSNQWAVKTEADRSRWPGYTRSPNDSLLRTFGVVLTRDDGAVELPVYWFEPKTDDEAE